MPAAKTKTPRGENRLPGGWYKNN